MSGRKFTEAQRIKYGIPDPKGQVIKTTTVVEAPGVTTCPDDGTKYTGLRCPVCESAPAHLVSPDAGGPREVRADIDIDAH